MHKRSQVTNFDLLGDQRLPEYEPGTLDDTSWLKPGAHNWTKSAQLWFRLDEDSLQYPHNPSGYDDLIQAFQLT